MNNNFLVQVIKYGIVGVLNTLLTAATIWIMMFLVFQTEKENPSSTLVASVSNITGYIVGLINSFVINRKWTFKSNNNWKNEFIKFIMAFLICYIPQFFLVNFLNTNTDYYFDVQPVVISHTYTCQLIGIVFYTSINFLLNKFFTFKQANKKIA